MIPEMIPLSTDSGRSGAWPGGRWWVRAQSIRQPNIWARRQPSIRAAWPLAALTSTVTPWTSKLLAESTGGMPRSSPSSWA